MSVSPLNEGNPCLQTLWDKKRYVEMASKILLLAPRDWAKESVYLLYKTHLPGNERAGVTLARKLM